MWNENDELIELADTLNGEGASFPTTCPSCGSRDCHAFMYKPSTVSKLGSLWVWCESCKGYAHFRGLVPEWISTPDFIDESKLCADVEYLHGIKDQIDAWLSDCFENEKSHNAG